jgi:hypothetical protein
MYGFQVVGMYENSARVARIVMTPVATDPKAFLQAKTRYG